MTALKRGEKVSQHIRINSHELLIFTNRDTGGKDYAALSEALDRLAGTRIRTNVSTGGEEQYENFGLVDAASIRRKRGLDGRLLWCEVKLSDWVFNAIRAQEVLTLHRDYFRLRKPLERRVYEIARKHCGQQDQWKIGLLTLLKKTGSQSPEKRFRQMIKHLAENDHLPDYSVTFDPGSDVVTFRNRGTVKAQLDIEAPLVRALDPETYHEARIAAPGWDVYELEREWRDWMAEPPKNPDRAFIGFCRKWAERRGRPR
jgi:plasmid replication initiation protein